MPAERVVDWTLVDFLEHLDLWVKEEAPTPERRPVVVRWIMALHDHPYRGVRRQAAFPNLWFGKIPGTLAPDDTIVTCSYFVEECTRTIACNHIASLRL